MGVIFLKNSVSILSHKEVVREKAGQDRRENQGSRSPSVSPQQEAVIAKLRTTDRSTDTVRSSAQAESLAHRLASDIERSEDSALAAHARFQGRRALDFLRL